MPPGLRAGRVVDSARLASLVPKPTALGALPHIAQGEWTYTGGRWADPASGHRALGHGQRP